ncbi:MAG: PspA/IM30 family protein [Caldisericia bacterium]|nr:PspA/IM30 family protein [Caldisericia bacterium]
MAGFWKRVGDILNSNVNDWLKTMEDPAKMLPFKIDEMRQQYAEAADALAESMASYKTTEIRLSEIKSDLNKYNLAAKNALGAGNEDLSRKCLARVVTLENQEKAAENSLVTQGQTNGKIKQVLDALKAKIEEASMKLDELVARDKASKAQEKVVKTMSGISTPDIGTTFDELEERVIKREQKVQALAEIGSIADSLDDEIAKSNNSDEIEQRLLRLKGA